MADADGQLIQRTLWGLAAHELDAAPTASAPRLYVETLNEMIDSEASRVSALNNRVPTAVLILEIAGAALALGSLATYLAVLGSSHGAPSLLAAGLVTLLLLVTFDLDRPTRGFIRVPATPLTRPFATPWSCRRRHPLRASPRVRRASSRAGPRPPRSCSAGEREEQRDRRQHEHDRDAEDDQDRGQGRARRGAVRDLQLLGKQVRVLGHAPAPDHGHDRADGEWASAPAGAAAEQDDHRPSPQSADRITSGRPSCVRPSYT